MEIMSLWGIAVTLAAAAVVTAVYVRRKRYNKDDRNQLHRPNFKKDLVYLIQFPVSPYIRSISPFSLKLETWLRLNKVPYENVYSVKFSRKGQIPYIELNGEQIADSNIIIKHLKRQYNLNPDAGLNKRDLAIAHAIAQTLEYHTSVIGFHWRYGYNNGEFCDKLMDNYTDRSVSMFFFRNIQPYGIRLKSFLHGVGRHQPDEIAEFSFDDLNAIASILDDNEFFLGSTKPTTIDCTLFGHLAQFLYIPMDFPQKKYMVDNCKNVVRYVDRMRDILWPDWEEMSKKECMMGCMGIDYVKN